MCIQDTIALDPEACAQGREGFVSHLLGIDGMHRQ
jgi:hypothetical protein